MIRRHKTPHSRNFATWLRRYGDQPFDARIIFQKYDADIWRLARPVASLPNYENVNDWYAAMIERAASRFTGHAGYAKLANVPSYASVLRRSLLSEEKDRR